MTKSLRVLLACLAFVLAFPAASAIDVGTRPVAAAFAHASSVAARPSQVIRAVAPVPARAFTPVVAPCAHFAARTAAARPTEHHAPDRRRLYLEKLSLLC
jgi:hypothetical protein